MVTILSFIVVVGLIILVHELGHFLAARSVGIRVDRFSIGFGPRLAAVRRGETEYRISVLPLGGYVKMAGMIDESLENPESFDPADPNLFMNKNVWQKVLVVSAGVIMNMILAAVVLWGVFAIRGIPSYPEDRQTVIDQPLSGYPAAESGLRRGDRIVAIDGIAVQKWEDLVAVVTERPGQEIAVDIERGGAPQTIRLTTKSESAPGREAPVGKVGIAPLPVFERVSVGEAFELGWVVTWEILARTAQSIGLLFRGEASIKDFAGPVGIAKLTGDYAKRGLGDLFEFLALISVNIGFLNILPVPALDGGHLVLVAIEGIRRRPLSTKVKLWTQQVGMVLLLALIVVVIFNDVMKLR